MKSNSSSSGRVRKRSAPMTSATPNSHKDHPFKNKQTNILCYFSTFKRPRASCRGRVPDTPPSLLSDKIEVESPPSLPRVSRLVITPPTRDDSTPAGESMVTSRIRAVKKNGDHKKPSGRLQQTYLDLGQRDFGKRTICTVCGMLYVNGLLEDSKQHDKMCQEFLRGVPFTTKNARIVNVVNQRNESFVVEIRPSDSYELRRKLKRIISIVDADLGFALLSNEADLGKTAYLFVRRRRVLGVATAQVISKAFPLVSMSERSNESRPAMIGIHKIWVHHAARKEGIATLLVDTVRSKFIFGLHVPLNMVAFSSPTDAGIKFATRYLAETGFTSVLVYDCNEK